MAESPAPLQGGFRLFFLAAAVWAIAALALWLGTLSALISTDLPGGGLAWHRHEMIFGFAGAAIAGFALTAVPNWTGRLPIAGVPLAALFLLWVAGRLLGLALSADSVVAVAIDGGFYILLAAILSLEIAHASSRNLPVVMVIALFGIADTADRVEMAGLLDLAGIGWRAGLILVALLIAVIGGRIVPSFTRNWLAARGASARLPQQPGRFDRAVIALSALAATAWLAEPVSLVTAILLSGAGLMNAARMLRWQGWRCFSDPLLLILHVGYGWLAIGLLLLGCAGLGLTLQSPGIHALSAGAMGTMILAVMSRASLGHTGRPLKAARLTVAAFWLVTLGSIGRVLAALGLGAGTQLLPLSGLAWMMAYFLFILVYLPILTRPRAERAGAGR